MRDRNLINAQEIAVILKVPVSWIYQRTCKGSSSIPVVKLGKYVRFNPDEVIWFFKRQESVSNESKEQ